MARRHFGTDGVRGVANDKLTPEFALALGRAIGVWLEKNGTYRRVCLGRDTRRSGEMLESALAAGIASSGVDVVRIGVAPTPAVAFVTRTGSFDLGGIISASHNPAPDNGIKFVTAAGSKTSDQTEEDFESLMEHLPAERPVGAGVGKIEDQIHPLDSYLGMLQSILPEGLKGLRIAVDAANGAAYSIGPEVLRLLGADVVTTGVSPDGMNINAEGGATKPHAIQAFTVESKADIGVAFDGDADRAVFSDELGQLINGDRTIGAWAVHQHRRGALSPPVVVGTVMSNGGFEAYLLSSGITLERTAVGDKYVSRRIDEVGAKIGGEQSGHIVFPERGPTGDGLVTMLELLGVMTRDRVRASEFTRAYEPWPQVLINLSVSKTEGWNECVNVSQAIKEGSSELGEKGRVLVRPSGTQPVIRVMVEARSGSQRDLVASRIVEAMTLDLHGEVQGQVDLTHALGD